jgi:tetratricopeptide (TPR) repeat protein
MRSNKEILIYAVIVLVALCAYANTLGHGFVYDDNRQILMNPLIQRSELYGKALTSDVWAFKSSDKVAASNYFRPAFVAWMIFNWKLFDANPLGWHVATLLLHIGTCLLLFVFLRRFGCEDMTSAAIAILFAVHPVHVENIAWISGATDALLSFFLLISLILAQSYAARRPNTSSVRSTGILALSLLAYVLALGTKEIALLCAPLYWLVLRSGETKLDSRYRLGSVTGLYLLAAAAFFIVRWRVLGSVFLPVEDPVSGNPFLSIPKIFVSYLQQIFFPLWLGPALPVRPVETVGLTNCVLPLIISCAVVAGLWLLARRTQVQKFGFALFVLTLLPVISPANFGTEHIVHDRYLYLPLAGILMVIVPGIILFVGEKNRTVLAVIFAILVLALGIKTYSYGGVWRTDETLWRYAVSIDPNSAHAWFNLGAAVTDPRDSLSAYENSIRIKRTGSGLAGKARALIALGDFEGAAATAREAISLNPNDISAYALFQAYEAESFALFNLRRHAEGEASLREARPRLPIYYGALTEKLAVILYVQDRKGEALAELEGARNQARSELLPASKQLFLRLGQLYAELGRKEDAKGALEEYLASTNTVTDQATLDDRRQAAELLRKIRGG